MLGKNFSRWHLIYFFLFFPRKRAWTFHANCLLCIINLSSVDFSYWALKIKKHIKSLVKIYEISPSKSPRKNVADGNTAGIVPSNSWSTVGPTSNSELSQWSWHLVTQIGQTNFHSPTPRGFMWNLAMICPVVSEEKKFEAFSLYESMKTSDPWGRAILPQGYNLNKRPTGHNSLTWVKPPLQICRWHASFFQYSYDKAMA